MSIFKFFRPDARSGQQFDAVKTHLLSQTEGIYWYPYSGFDLTPVVLDLPHNKTNRNLLSTTTNGMPLILSDVDDSFGDVVSHGSTNGRGLYRDYLMPYSDLHTKLKHNVEPLPETRIFGEFQFKGSEGPVSKFKALLFQVRLKTHGIKKVDFQHQEENPKWVTAIHAPTHALMQAFICCQVKIETLAIIRVGGFAQHHHYPKLHAVFPDMFVNPENPVFPRFLITDISFFSHFGGKHSLEHAEFIETGLRMDGWGYSSVSMYEVRARESSLDRWRER